MARGRSSGNTNAILPPGILSSLLYNFRSLDVLRALMEIYVADPIYTESLEQYSLRIGFSPINAACKSGDQGPKTRLLDHALTATLHDRDIFIYLGKHHCSARQVCQVEPYSRDDATTVDLSKHEDVICFLLDRGCSVRDSTVYQRNEETSDSSHRIAELEQTVLSAAVTHMSYKMVSRLIAEGAEVHARQRWEDPTNCYHYRRSTGVTALHIASLFWNIEGIKAPMDHCGDVSVAEMVTYADDHGRPPIHWALMGYRNEWYARAPETTKDQDPIPPRMINILKLLLEANPNTINAQSDQGATVFSYALKSDTGVANIATLVNMLLGAKPLASTLKLLQSRVPDSFAGCSGQSFSTILWPR
ncbi:ankyrin [Penicillium odoratum]|uniref:ankyrin n=1 Tax=Penicillium odoratum TaxID=1167516 RepID=UPI00254998B5|nr:ankyrin [Penicillium odoratum]KAJ5752985.1 ankyrin [Penicillium odoratum]